MASLIAKFMRGDIYRWVQAQVSPLATSIFPKKNDFWITPIAKDELGYAEIVSKLVSTFERTEIRAKFEIDGVGIILLVIKESDSDAIEILLCSISLDGSKRLALAKALSFGTSYTNLTFLQKMKVVTEFGAVGRGKISSHVWQDGTIFEADLEPHLPDIQCVKLNLDMRNEPPEALFVRLLLALDITSEYIQIYEEELIEVMLAIPKSDHAWLIEQLMHAILSGRDTNFFSELYKIVEFFFPLHKITKLKDSLGYGGTSLELLSLCQSDLGWHVNHQLGSRLALNYANVAFAEILLDKKYDGKDPEAERKFKEGAMEKITILRHTIVHQNFKHAPIASVDLHRATRALLEFLQSSFQTYSLEQSAVSASHHKLPSSATRTQT